MLRQLFALIILCLYVGYFALNIFAARADMRPFVALVNGVVFVLLFITAYDQARK